MANFFTEKEKDHKSHDVLILCLSCNMRLDTVQLALRRSLAGTCNAPIACRKHSPFINDVHLSKVCKYLSKYQIFYFTCLHQKVRSAGRALSNSANQIPEEKKQELQTVIANHFNIERIEVNADYVKEASQINPRYVSQH